MAAGILAPASGAIRVVGMDLRSHLLECSQRTGFLSGDTQLCQRPEAARQHRACLQAALQLAPGTVFVPWRLVILFGVVMVAGLLLLRGDGDR